MKELALVAAAAMTAMTSAALWHSAIATQKPLVASLQPRKEAWVRTPVRIPPRVAVVPVAKPKAPAIALASPDRVAADPKAPDEDIDRDGAKMLHADEPVLPEAQLDMQANDVGEHLRSQVPSDVMRYFDVFLYVSKAGEGPWSQHMFIFHRADNGSLVYEKNIPVSTGRERHEKYFTSTPTGIFELDPARFEPMHYSHTWHGAPMAWAMFLNYTLHGRQVGIALHSAGPHIADLGHRASGGCVRLPPDQASLLFHRFQSEERGMVPVWAFDENRRTTSNMGEVVRDASGQPLMTEGYKVLLVIEDYPGGPAVVAVLS